MLFSRYSENYLHAYRTHFSLESHECIIPFGGRDWIPLFVIPLLLETWMHWDYPISGTDDRREIFHSLECRKQMWRYFCELLDCRSPSIENQWYGNFFHDLQRDRLKWCAGSTTDSKASSLPRFFIAFSLLLWKLTCIENKESVHRDELTFSVGAVF